MAIDIFDYINQAIFGKQLSSMATADKKKHAFMVNRFLSIGHPIEANRMNLIRINPLSVAIYWNLVMTRKYRKVPNWIYVKGRKTEKLKKKDRFEKFEPEVFEFYKRRKAIDQRDIDFLIEIGSDELFDELTRVSGYLKELKK